MRCGCCGRELPDPPSPMQLVALELPELPVAEMIDRGWLGYIPEDADRDEIMRRMLEFWGVDSEKEMRDRFSLSGRQND